MIVQREVVFVEAWCGRCGWEALFTKSARRKASEHVRATNHPVFIRTEEEMRMPKVAK